MSLPGRRDLLKLGSAFGLAGAAHLSFAAAPHAGSPASPALFDVRTFGTRGDGKSLDTPAINAAIDAAAAAGGGTVLFPAGTYLCFSIHLRSRVHLYLSQGATILAADSPKPGETTGHNGGTYDAAESNAPWEAFQDFGHNHWHNSLLWGENLADVSITGPGLIDGRGLSNGRGHDDPLNNPFKAEQPGVGNKAIALKNCRNVLFRDLRILKGGHFGLLLTGVDNLTIDNLTIDTDRDGMDLDCCRNSRVSNCTVNSPWDDGICPKSSFALGFARPTDTLTITNCFVTGTYELGSVLDGSFRKFSAGANFAGTGRIKCGTESNGGFRNITISNCVFEGCQGLALESVDGALIEDIAIANITMRDIVSAPLFFRLGARLRGPKDSTKPGTLRRISVTNLTSSNAGAPISSIISGIPGTVIEDLHLASLYLHHAGSAPASATNDLPEREAAYPEPNMFGPTPSQGLFLRHARRVDLSHVEIASATPDPRPALVLSNVDRIDILALTAPATPAIALRTVTDLRVLLSRAAKDTILATADHQTL